MYPELLAALDDLGLQHPEVRKLADAAAASARAESVAVIVPDVDNETPGLADTKVTPIIPRKGVGGMGAGSGRVASAKGGKKQKKSSTERFVEGGFRPDDQRLLILLRKFVLVKSDFGREVGNDGGGGGCYHRVREISVVTLQRHCGGAILWAISYPVAFLNTGMYCVLLI